MDEDMRYLIGTTEDVQITEEWKDKIWKCPSCKFWFPIDWNHDDEVCCACAGCTRHPFLGHMVECQCPRCKSKRLEEIAKAERLSRLVGGNDEGTAVEGRTAVDGDGILPGA